MASTYPSTYVSLTALPPRTSFRRGGSAAVGTGVGAISGAATALGVGVGAVTLISKGVLTPTEISVSRLPANRSASADLGFWTILGAGDACSCSHSGLSGRLGILTGAATSSLGLAATGGGADDETGRGLGASGGGFFLAVIGDAVATGDVPVTSSIGGGGGVSSSLLKLFLLISITGAGDGKGASMTSCELGRGLTGIGGLGLSVAFLSALSASGAGLDVCTPSPQAKLKFHVRSAKRRSVSA